MKTKAELRQYIRDMKCRFSQQELREMALLVVVSVITNEKIKSANTILLYHALPDEVPTRGLLQEFLSQGKTILLPRVVSDTEMTIHRYTCEKDLTKGAYGILEPCGEQYDGKIDVAIVPGVAFDNNGCRLGRGKGYYDRFLSSQANIYKIGVCYPFQLLDSVPSVTTDVLMDEVVSPY